jgi:TonB family protein
MSRLQQKCLLGATGAHALLIGILVVGPAFVSSTPKPDNAPVLTWIPDITTDKPFSGGGTPNVLPPPPAPKPEPKPEPTPPKPIPTPPVPEVRLEPKPEPVPSKPAPVEPIKSTEPDFVERKPVRKLPDVSLTPVVRKTGKAKPAKAVDDEPDPRALAQARAQAFSSTARSLRNNLSGTTAVDTSPGPGGGGPSYANFNQTVMSAYFHAWHPPAGIANEKAVTQTSVTIARDGTVIDAHITVPSGDRDMDASVQRVLDRVRRIAPLPADSHESQRVVNVNFDLTAKRALG